MSGAETVAALEYDVSSVRGTSFLYHGPILIPRFYRIFAYFSICVAAHENDDGATKNNIVTVDFICRYKHSIKITREESGNV